MSVMPLENKMSNDYKNPNVLIELRVAGLISKIIIGKKNWQMRGIWGQRNTILVDMDGRLHIENLPKYYPHGIGQIGRLNYTTQFLYNKTNKS
jgi:hypothetical protein